MNDEKKIVTGRTLKAKKCSLKLSPNTRAQPMSVRSRKFVTASPMLENTSTPVLVLSTKRPRKNWSRAAETTSGQGMPGRFHDSSAPSPRKTQVPSKACRRHARSPSWGTSFRTMSTMATTASANRIAKWTFCGIWGMAFWIFVITPVCKSTQNAVRTASGNARRRSLKSATAIKTSQATEATIAGALSPRKAFFFSRLPLLLM
mmetsp:Transcript_61380/g.174341  ORF Transcript_61380/g.174341 Transcript_61380/m.174341 type:complete len:204 (-) Transcript_61380:41-652(-)